MKELFEKAKEVEYYKELNGNPKVWIYPLIGVLLVGILLLLQLFFIGDPSGRENIRSLQTDSNQIEEQTTVAPTDTFAGVVEAKDQEILPSFIHENKNGWQLLARNEVFQEVQDWHVIGMMNQGKIRFPLYAEQAETWAPMIEGTRKLHLSPYEQISQGSQISFSSARKKHYALQLISASQDQFQELYQWAERMVMEGIPAYLVRSKDKVQRPNGRGLVYYYQLRVGFYESGEDALAVGEVIRKQYNDPLFGEEPFWAVKPSSHEMDSELVDFAGLRSRPITIQLSTVKTKKDALQQLRIAAARADYAFVSQAKTKRGKYVYRVRVGFFENRTVAQTFLMKMQWGNKLFDSARIVKITYPLLAIDEAKIDHSQIIR